MKRSDSSQRLIHNMRMFELGDLVPPSSTVNQVCDAQQIQSNFWFSFQSRNPEDREKEGEYLSERKFMFRQPRLHRGVRISGPNFKDR